MRELSMNEMEEVNGGWPPDHAPLPEYAASIDACGVWNPVTKTWGPRL